MVFANLQAVRLFLQARVVIKVASSEHFVNFPLDDLADTVQPLIVLSCFRQASQKTGQ